MDAKDICEYYCLVYSISMLVCLFGLILTNKEGDENRLFLMYVPVINTVMAIKFLWIMLKKAVEQ